MKYANLCKLFLIISASSIVGCQQLQGQYDSLHDSVNSFVKTGTNKNSTSVDSLEGKTFIKTSLLEMCNDYRLNNFTAKDKWEGKYVEIKDKIVGISGRPEVITGLKRPMVSTFNFTTTTTKGRASYCSLVAYPPLDELKNHNNGEIVTIRGLVSISDDNTTPFILMPAEIK